MSSYIKIGVVLILLLILVVGPLLQIYDCFNDSPNLDHDGLLHTIDALLSIALILALNVTLFLALAMLFAVQDKLKQLRYCGFILFCIQPTPSISPQSLALRI